MSVANWLPGTLRVCRKGRAKGRESEISRTRVLLARPVNFIRKKLLLE